MRISVDEPSALSTWMRGGESWRVSEGKMRKIDGAAAVRARPGDESVARAYLDLVAAAKLGDHANLVALRELGQRLVHQVSHVLASPAHRGSAHGARVPSDVTQSCGPRERNPPQRPRVTFSRVRRSRERRGRRPPWVRSLPTFPRTHPSRSMRRDSSGAASNRASPPPPPPPGFPATPSHPHLKQNPPPHHRRQVRGASRPEGGDVRPDEGRRRGRRRRG